MIHLWQAIYLCFVVQPAEDFNDVATAATNFCLLLRNIHISWLKLKISSRVTNFNANFTFTCVTDQLV